MCEQPDCSSCQSAWVLWIAWCQSYITNSDRQLMGPCPLPVAPEHQSFQRLKVTDSPLPRDGRRGLIAAARSLRSGSLLIARRPENTSSNLVRFDGCPLTSAAFFCIPRRYQRTLKEAPAFVATASSTAPLRPRAPSSWRPLRPWPAAAHRLLRPPHLPDGTY